MLRYGRISEVDADKGLSKVTFREDGIVSDWMPMIVPKSKGDSYIWTLEINQEVACMMDQHQERGVILGSIYSRDLQPVDSGDDVVAISFSNGDFIKYDRGSGQMELKASGGVSIEGDLSVEGRVDATGNVTSDQDVYAGLTSLGSHTHNVTVSGNPETTTTTAPL